MGYDLTCTLGYGVKLNEPEEPSILTTEQRDIVEDLYFVKDSIIKLEFAGTDGYTSEYILHKNSIFGADWCGSTLDANDLTNCIKSDSIFCNELQSELAKNDIIISGEHFKWWLLPRWF